MHHTTQTVQPQGAIPVKGKRIKNKTGVIPVSILQLKTSLLVSIFHDRITRQGNKLLQNMAKKQLCIIFGAKWEVFGHIFGHLWGIFGAYWKHLGSLL